MTADIRAARAAVLHQLADLVDAARRPHPVRVAVDGPDAAGKTTLADELADTVRQRGREVVRASVDGFHRPRAERYRRGEDSAVGYFEDAFDYPALRGSLLDPLGPGGDRRHVVSVFDFRTDKACAGEIEVAGPDAVLIVDGVFLLRACLRDAFDVRIFCTIGFDEILRRACRRDVELFGSEDEVVRRYRDRYLPAQRLYFATDRPELAADAVVDNEDPDNPTVRMRNARTRP